MHNTQSNGWDQSVLFLAWQTSILVLRYSYVLVAYNKIITLKAFQDTPQQSTQLDPQSTTGMQNNRGATHL